MEGARVTFHGALFPPVPGPTQKTAAAAANLFFVFSSSSSSGFFSRTSLINGIQRFLGVIVSTGRLFFLPPSVSYPSESLSVRFSRGLTSPRLAESEKNSKISISKETRPACPMSARGLFAHPPSVVICGGPVSHREKNAPPSPGGR